MLSGIKRVIYAKTQCRNFYFICGKSQTENIYAYSRLNSLKQAVIFDLESFINSGCISTLEIAKAFV
jgi:hypothetical protein